MSVQWTLPLSVLMNACRTHDTTFTYFSKSLVSGRDESEPLLLRVARGANVMEEHEAALVELCMTPGANDKEVEECVTTIMAGIVYSRRTNGTRNDGL